MPPPPDIIAVHEDRQSLCGEACVASAIDWAGQSARGRRDFILAFAERLLARLVLVAIMLSLVSAVSGHSDPEGKAKNGVRRAASQLDRKKLKLTMAPTASSGDRMDNGGRDARTLEPVHLE